MVIIKADTTARNVHFHLMAMIAKIFAALKMIRVVMSHSVSEQPLTCKVPNEMTFVKCLSQSF